MEDVKQAIAEEIEALKCQLKTSDFMVEWGKGAIYALEWALSEIRNAE